MPSSFVDARRCLGLRSVARRVNANVRPTSRVAVRRRLGPPLAASYGDGLTLSGYGRQVPGAYVAISGPSDAAPPDLVDAETVARWAAEHGHVVVCGGLDGVMAAAARGAAAAGGTSVGLLPGDTRDGAAPELTVALATGLGDMRNALLVRTSDVVVCIGGSWGTLSELALAVRTGVPVIALRTWVPAGAPGRLLEVGSADEVCDALATYLDR